MDEPNKLEQDIIRQAVIIPDQAGNDTKVIKDKQAFDLAKEYKTKIHDIYTLALTRKIIPCRFIRNLHSISPDEQLKLWESKVGIIGAGGLGGQIILNLARIGIGYMTIVDHDVFDETNLNRQALSSSEVIGKSKALTALSIINSINPGVEANACQVKIDRSNGGSILEGSDIIVDALDNVPDRFLLEDIARGMGIPLVHGAVAGFEGQIMSIFPDDTGLESLYGREKKEISSENNPASILGIPAIAPAVIASLQTMEVIKILLKKGQPLKNRLAVFDIEGLDLRKFSFKD